ncbi:MAG: hypothetical protein STSR0009_30960 [Methanoregula sp.]
MTLRREASWRKEGVGTPSGTLVGGMAFPREARGTPPCLKKRWGWGRVTDFFYLGGRGTPPQAQTRRGVG